MTEQIAPEVESVRRAFYAGFEHGANPAKPGLPTSSTQRERRAFNAGAEEGQSAAASGALTETTRHGPRSQAIQEEYEAWLEDDGDEEDAEPEPQPDVPRAILEVYRDAYGKGYQISIGDDSGGWRLYGISFIGRETLLAKKVLERRDRNHIREYLDAVDAYEDAESRLEPYTVDSPWRTLADDLVRRLVGHWGDIDPVIERYMAAKRFFEVSKAQAFFAKAPPTRTGITPERDR